MPEGDSIHKLAALMRPHVLGRPLRALHLRERGVIDALAGEPVASVEALGKHLLVGVGERWVARTHLGMSGRWHVYRADEPWRLARSRARAAGLLRLFRRAASRAAASLRARRASAAQPARARPARRRL